MGHTQYVAKSRDEEAAVGLSAATRRLPFSPQRLSLFLLGGGSAALLNLALAYFAVEVVGLRSTLQENLVNVAVMEISLVYSFFIYRAFVWKVRDGDMVAMLLRQLPLYHLSAGAGVLARIAIFPLLQYLGVHYLLNIGLGILIASLVNYALTGRYVFNRPAAGRHP